MKFVEFGYIFCILEVKLNIRIFKLTTLSNLANMTSRTMKICGYVLLMIPLTHTYQCSAIFENETTQPVDLLQEFENAAHFGPVSENQFNVHERTGPNPNEASMTTVRGNKFNWIKRNFLPDKCFVNFQVELITGRGYPVEIHYVTSSDGYILELHRIPHGKDQKMASNVSRRPVFLQHGLFSTDNVWLILPNALGIPKFFNLTFEWLLLLLLTAFILADQVYDVWLGNARGSTYSRRHVSLDPAKENYWSFS